jgi:hypothetical protein
LQAGGRRFDPVNLHQYLEARSENRYSSLVALVSAFADRKKQFFKNLEEVKKVIHANVDTGRPVCANAEKHGF